MLQEFDTIIVEGRDPQLQQQLLFSRIPAPQEDAEDAASDGNSSVSSTDSFGKQQKQQQALSRQQQQSMQPIPVEIPNSLRHVNSFGRMAAGSSGAVNVSAAAAAGSTNSATSSSLKYDPLAAKKKGPKAAAPQQQQHAAPAPSMNGSSGAEHLPTNNSIQHENSSDSVSELIAGLDANVASQLDPANMPAFLRTPERRDGQDSFPTQSF